MFDVNNRASFDALDSWRDEFLAQACPSSAEQFPFVVVGNQIDKEEGRVVTEDEARAYANGINATYVETSASTGHNVASTFRSLVTTCVDRIRQIENASNDVECVEIEMAF